MPDSVADYLRGLFALDGRVALVTGASGDIGRALAHGLAMAGARVALHGRSTEKLAVAEKLIADGGGTAASFASELAEDGAIPALVQGVLDRFGRIDILVNCAGMNRRQPILEVDRATYDRIMEVNLHSAYFLTRAVVPSMIEQGGGKIIHIGSLNAAVGLESVSVYGLTKGALAQTTKVMAIEWARHNIQVNCLCPGFIKTELTGPLWADERRNRWIFDRLSIKRPGLPSDLVGMAIFLASPASSYMTGQAVYVDGGFTAGSPW